MAKRKGDGKRRRPKQNKGKNQHKNQEIKRVVDALSSSRPAFQRRGESKKVKQRHRKRKKLWKHRSKYTAGAKTQIEGLLHAKLTYQRCHTVRDHWRWGRLRDSVYIVNSKTPLCMPNGSAPFNVTTLYHGTSIHNLPSILKDGQLIPSNYGLLGYGVYLGRFEKALIFARARDEIITGVVLECDAACGREYCHGRSYKSKYPPEGYHCKVGKAHFTHTWGTSTLRNDEWCFPNPNQVRIKAVHILSRITEEEEV